MTMLTLAQTPSAGGSVLSVLALCLALLALLCAGVLFVFLRKSNRELKQTLVVITHDEEIALSADRVIALEDGRIASDTRAR